jgi:hypothetical protein
MRGGYLGRGSSILIVVTPICLLAFSIAIFTFAKRQDIWIDETTQLSGITLKFGEMLHWLSGQDTGRFAVPADRMPPVSYVLDWIWLRLFGASELGFRLFHAAFLLAGVALLVATARRNLDLTAALITLAVLCLSPKLIQAAVEIRAYPIFFAAACAQTAVFLRITNDRNTIDRKLLALFVVVSIITVYTHFFGLVSSAAFFLALVLAYTRHRAALVEIFFAFVITLVASIGILPFAFSAAAMSNVAAPDEQAASSHQYVNYFLKLIGDSANVISLPAAVLFLGGALVLFLVGGIAAMRRMLIGKSKAADWLFVVVIAGVSATLVASHFIKTFAVLKTAYSLWIFAPVTLCMASGAIASAEMRYWNSIYRIAVMATVVGATVSTYTFLVHASEFVHGPGEFVGGLYDRAEAPKAVVYETGAAWGWSYFPLVFCYKGEIAQYRPADGGTELVRIAAGPPPPAPQQILAAVSPYNNLILVNVRLRTYQDIRQCNANACPPFAPGEVEATLIGSGHWREVAVERRFGLYDSQAKIFSRSN